MSVCSLIQSYLIPLLQFRVPAVGGALLFLDWLPRQLQAGLQEVFAAGQFPLALSLLEGSQSLQAGASQFLAPSLGMLAHF